MDWIEYGRTILKQEGHDDWSFRLDIEALPSLCIHGNKYIWLAEVHQNDIFYIVHEIAHIPFLNLDEGDLGHHRKWAAEFYRLLVTYVIPQPVGGTAKELVEGDRRATQLHMILNVLTGHCEKYFCADKIEAAMADIKREISEGSCAWAFKGPEGASPAKWVKWPSIHDGRWVCGGCSHPMGAANIGQLPEVCPGCGAIMTAPESCPECGRSTLGGKCVNAGCSEFGFWKERRCSCQSSPPGFVSADGIHCSNCGGVCRPAEPPKTIPKVVIDAFKADEAALLKEHQEEHQFDFPIIEGPIPVSKRPSKTIQCCDKCVSFHRSKTIQLVTLADPDSPNDGCRCKCHDPSTPEGADLTKHFDSLDLQDEVDKMEDAPDRQSNGQPPKASANGTKDVPSETLATRAPTDEPEFLNCPGCGAKYQTRRLPDECLRCGYRPPPKEPDTGHFPPPIMKTRDSVRVWPGPPVTGPEDDIAPVDSVHEDCDHCAGTGEAKLDKDGNELYNGVMGKCPYCSPPDEELCPTCNGSGFIPETGAGCPSCSGKGIARPTDEPEKDGEREPQPLGDRPSVYEVRKDAIGFDIRKRKCPECGEKTGISRSLCPSCGASMEE